MARRRKVRLPAAAWVDWSPQIAALFDGLHPLVHDLDPPKRARLFHGIRHLTVIAKFSNADGVFATLKVRVAR